MKKILFTLIFSLLFVIACNSQSPSSLRLRCPPPNANTYQIFSLQASGDAAQTLCPGKRITYTGIYDFSGATVVGISGGSGDVTAQVGAHTTNFFPYWTNGASKVIGNSPYSWNGTLYTWNNTTNDAIFKATFTPSKTGAGSFRLGTASGTPTFLELSETGTSTLSVSHNLTFTSTGVSSLAGNSLNFTALATDINFTATTGTGLFTATSKGGFTFDSAAGGSITNKWDIGDGRVRIGDVGGAGNSVLFDLFDSNKSIDFLVPAVGGDFAINRGATTGFEINRGGNEIDIGDLSEFVTGITLDTGLHTAALFGDVTTVGQAGTEIKLNHTGDVLNTRASVWDLGDSVLANWGVSTFKLLRTITTAGTTGNQTINRPNGSVNIAAGNSSVVVSNNTVTTSSTIIAVANTNDATCSVKNAVPGASSITITMTAGCTAETRVAFWVWN